MGAPILDRTSAVLLYNFGARSRRPSRAVSTGTFFWVHVSTSVQRRELSRRSFRQLGRLVANEVAILDVTFPHALSAAQNKR
jgi:hypothetical protein